MQEHQLVVIAGSAREVLARIIGILLPEDCEMTGVRFSRPPGSETSRTLLTIRVPTSQRLELIVKRLQRLIAVRSVAVLDGVQRGLLSQRKGLHTGGANDRYVAGTTRWSTGRSIECNCDPMELSFINPNLRMAARQPGSRLDLGQVASPRLLRGWRP